MLVTPLQLVFRAAGLVAAVASLPLFLELLVLATAARLRPRNRRIATTDSLCLAVVIPAHNEEKLIAACLRSILASPLADRRIYVVAHNCSDDTAAQATQTGATVLVLNNQAGGKGRALDHGFTCALAAGADAVLVVDADSIVSPNLLPAVAARLAAGAPAVQCRYEVANAGATPRTRLASLAFLGMNVLRPRGRDRLGLSCGIFGNGFALSAATLRCVPYTANSLVEDLEYHLHVLRAGLRVHFLDEAKVLGEMPEASAAAATQRARWEGGRLLMRRQWTLPLLHDVARGRLRMLEPLLDLLAVPLATEAALLVVVLLLAWPAHFAALAIFAVCGILTLMFYVVIAATLGPDPWSSLQAIARAPAYLAFKVMMIPATRRAARRNSTWIRTERNTAASTSAASTSATSTSKEELEKR